MATDSLASAWRAVLLSRLQLTTRRSGLNLRQADYVRTLLRVFDVLWVHSRGLPVRVELRAVNCQIIAQEQRLAVRIDQLSVYFTGGGGTYLEPSIASHYLAALIAEAGARGVLGTVVAVKTQQSEIDAPLDDLAIDGQLSDGTATRLDLQITTTLSFTGRIRGQAPCG